jgi:nickel transport protein
MIEQQKALISRETGQLKRELAALREELKRPGMREIVAGIGYIFGLAGVGLYLQAQKSRDPKIR